jgi:hypothetical protein
MCGIGAQKPEKADFSPRQPLCFAKRLKGFHTFTA